MRLLQGGGDVFVLLYGVVIFWGMEEEAVEEFSRILKEVVDTPLSDPEEDGAFIKSICFVLLVLFIILLACLAAAVLTFLFCLFAFCVFCVPFYRL